MKDEFDERSYGIIPLKKEEGVYKVFLVRLRSGNHWSFPKGHAEEGESAKETAERELFEEAGLKIVRYLSDDPITESYSVKGKGSINAKRVEYFIAEVEGEPIIQEKEILEFILADPQDVIHLLTHDTAKNVWNTANALIFN